MSPYRHCPACRVLIWTFNGKEERHRCQPKWFVWNAEYDEEEATPVHASDAEEAATKYAEEYDQDGDYTIVAGSPITVCVAAGLPGHVERFEVHGESVPEYRATKLKVP